MDISASRNQTGENVIEIGPITLTLTDEVVQSLQNVIHKRLSQTDEEEAAMLAKKMLAYKALANKMSGIDDRVMQKLAVQLKPEQLITMVRLADGPALYEKILNNLSKSNRTQFTEDYRSLDKITHHQALMYMEQIVPFIKSAAQEQKELLATLAKEDNA